MDLKGVVFCLDYQSQFYQYFHLLSRSDAHHSLYPRYTVRFFITATVYRKGNSILGLRLESSNCSTRTTINPFSIVIFLHTPFTTCWTGGKASFTGGTKGPRRGRFFGGRNQPFFGFLTLGTVSPEVPDARLLNIVTTPTI